MRVEALLKRAIRLQGPRDEYLEEEWDNLCAVAKESLMAGLEAKIAAHPEEEEPPGEDLDPVDLETFHTWLAESAEQSKQQYFANRRKKR